MRRFDKQHPSIPTPYTLPDHRVLAALLELTNRHDLDYASFCREAQNEVAITSQIMRAARAIRAGRENGVEDLRHAVAIIGLRRVRSILESMSHQGDADNRRSPHGVPDAGFQGLSESA